MKLEVSTSMKVKNLRKLIYDTAEQKEDIPVDRMQLQVEGGDILQNGMKALEEYNLKDGSNIMVEILDKANAPTPRERKPRVQKEEQKVTIGYNVRGQDLSSKVDVPKSTKVKQLKKIILQELGMEETGDLRIYVNDAEFENEKAGLKDLQLDEANGSIDVEVIFKILIEVHGKGKQYSDTVIVTPNEPLDVLRSRVAFFKLFLQRRHQVVEKDTGKQLDNLALTFRDYNLKNGSLLVLKEPGKDKVKSPRRRQDLFLE